MQKHIKYLAVALAAMPAASEAYATDLPVPPATDGAYAAKGEPNLPPGIVLTPGQQTLMNLGAAGLIKSLSQNDQFGVAQSRIGNSRTTISTVNGGGPAAGFKDDVTTFVGAISGLHELPAASGASFLRFSAELDAFDAAPNIVEQDGYTGRVDVQYLRAPTPNTLFGIGAFVENLDLDIVSNGGTIDRYGYGVRADLLHKLDNHWGFATRAEYSVGETSLAVPAGPAIFTHDQGDDRFYTQTELVGTFSRADFAWLSESWVLRPIIGMNFQRNFIEATADSNGVVSSGVVGDTEDYGTIWTQLNFVKVDPRPNAINPFFGVGLEQEYVNDLDQFVDESTFLTVSAGFTINLPRGSLFVFEYDRHQGLNDNRNNQSIVTSVSMNF